MSLQNAEVEIEDAADFLAVQLGDVVAKHGKSAVLSSMAASKRSISCGLARRRHRRLGMSKSSASSTIAVLITTPGETPMPFLISIVNAVLVAAD